MDATKMSPEQLSRLVAEARKQKFDSRRWEAIKKSPQQLGQAGKAMDAIAKQNPAV